MAAYLLHSQFLKIFVTNKFPISDAHFLISPFTSPKSHKGFLLTATLLSKSLPISFPLSLCRFSTAAVTLPAVQGQEGEWAPLSLEELFLPPETDVSSLKDTAAPLSARILKCSNIVLSKFAGGGVEVEVAEFVKSSVRTEDCLADGRPEFALVGRSNVGKSSLLNSLVRRKRLALSSKKPGKTQCINHFKINDSWYLVDLPGYGYAAAPHEVRTDWDKFTKD